MQELPLPPHFAPGRVGEVWRVPYEERAREGRSWGREHALCPAVDDSFRLCLLIVDVQNTFCIPGFELFVAGRSGAGAVDDNRRLCEFVYRNLGMITQIVPSLDTHELMQIFHAVWLVDDEGEHPRPHTRVSHQDIESGRWMMNSTVARALDLDPDYAARHLAHYTEWLAAGDKYELMIWPYHAMLGGIGHALVSAVEEAIFFHGVARHSRPNFRIKGNNPLTEHYSMLGPEVTEGPDGDRIGGPDTELVESLQGFNAVAVAGQAKSHCLTWTIDHLLEQDDARGRLAERTYLLEDCTSPVVIPGMADFTEQADAAFKRYAAAGMHVVRSTDPIEAWPGLA